MCALVLQVNNVVNVRSLNGFQCHKVRYYKIHTHYKS